MGRTPDAVTRDAGGGDARRDAGTIVDPIDPGGFVAGGGCDCRASGTRGDSLLGALLLLGLSLVVTRPRTR